MGAMPDILPGYQKVADPEVASGSPLPGESRFRRERGLRIPEMFDAAVDGRLKALIVFGEDIAQTDPDSGHVRAAIDACELVVSQEIFLSETAALADVVLPAAVLPREGRHLHQLRPPRPAGAPGARPTGRGKARLRDHPRARRRLGVDLGCPTPAAAFAEMASLTPTFGGISHERLEREGPIAWPCRSLADVRASGGSTASASRPRAARPSSPRSPTRHQASSRTPSSRSCWSPGGVSSTTTPAR